MRSSCTDVMKSLHTKKDGPGKNGAGQTIILLYPVNICCCTVGILKDVSEAEGRTRNYWRLVTSLAVRLRDEFLGDKFRMEVGDVCNSETEGETIPPSVSLTSLMMPTVLAMPSDLLPSSCPTTRVRPSSTHSTLLDHT